MTQETNKKQVNRNKSWIKKGPRNSRWSLGAHSTGGHSKVNFGYKRYKTKCHTSAAGMKLGWNPNPQTWDRLLPLAGPLSPSVL